MLHLTNPHNFYRLGCRKKIYHNLFFRFGASRSILSRFFDLNGFTLVMDVLNILNLSSKINSVSKIDDEKFFQFQNIFVTDLKFWFRIGHF